MTNYQDKLYCNTSIILSRMDRLRVLWHGRLSVHTETPTAEVVNPGEIISSVSVPRIFRLPSRRRMVVRGESPETRKR